MVPRERKNHLQSFLFSVCTIFFFFGFVEAVFRVAGYEPVFHYKTYAIPSWMKEMDPLVLERYKQFVAGQGFVNEDIYAYQPDIRYGYRLKPNRSITVQNYSSALVVDKLPPWTIYSGRDGFRVHSKGRVDAGSAEKTVHVLGDSSSFGWGVDYEKIYSFLLVEKLNSIASPSSWHFNLRNLSLPGFSSFDGKLLWEEFGNIKKGDWVVLSFGSNDSYPSFQTDRSQYESRNSLVGKINWNLKHLLLFRWMRTWLVKRPGREHETGFGRRVPLTQYRKNLEFLVDEIRKRQAHPALVSICNFSEYQETARQTAVNKKIVYLNFPTELKPFLPTIHNRYPDLFVTYFEAYGKDMEANPMLVFQFPDHCHPNEIGHSLISEVLFDKFEVH